MGIKENLKDEKEKMRTLVRGEARKYGREVKKANGIKKDEKFNEKIKNSIMDKGRNHLNLFEEKYDKLPFEHYYVIYGRVVDTGGDNDLIISCMNELRSLAIAGRNIK